MLLVMANRLESRERLKSIIDGQVAAGLTKKGTARRHMRDLNRAAYGRKHASRPATAGDLAAIGIKVVRSG